MRSARRDRLLSWGVHLFTASGAVLGTFAIVAIATGQLACAALLMLVTLFIDGVDGTLARAVGVSTHVPEIDGRRLDDIIDFQNFVIVPAVFLWGAGGVLHVAWLAVPVTASALGFARRDAKTEDDYFLGFPSYWNVLAIYLWLLGIGPLVGTLWVAVLAVGVFVPLKYLYPSKVQPMRLRVALGIGAIVWSLALALCVVWHGQASDAPVVPLAVATLAYPAWYLYLSFTRGGLKRSASRLDPSQV